MVAHPAPCNRATGADTGQPEALRPYQRLFRDLVEPADLSEQRALLHGYDAIVILPGSRPGYAQARRSGLVDAGLVEQRFIVCLAGAPDESLDATAKQLVIRKPADRAALAQERTRLRLPR